MPGLIGRRGFMAGMSALGLSGASVAGSQTMPSQWDKIVEQTRLCQLASLKLNFTGDWRFYKPPHFKIKPPAEESRLVRVEQQIGRPLPKTLRHFFKECSSGIDTHWLLPGHMSDTGGLIDVKYNLVPPKPFSDEKNEPLINSGGVRIDLEEMPDLWAARNDWITSFRQSAAEAEDEGTKAHYTVYANMMERGFPITTNGGGDIVAIDMESPGEELFISFHDGSDEPAWLFGQSLLDHLDQQSRLNFLGFEIYILEIFANEQKSKAAFDRFNETYKDRQTVEKEGLAAMSGCVIDWTTENGKAWRAWLGLTA
ncbi:SMI1/KNR4 family protein [Rhizobium skierniewicense]|uniref:SMI1/KNR4 family protein n=1 Tax=Rhizobium skierniewicense TaxID=984260 RepID=UPI001574709D|nr:SMI1/KNR4 family protein [Rhizobium skierniewicense]NTF31162.1 hypothetical protein [Rhizobium skierniewicense]